MKAYVLTLCAAALCVSLCSLLLPEGGMKAYARMASSILISLSTLMPFAAVFGRTAPEELFTVTQETMTREEAQEAYQALLRDSLRAAAEDDLSRFGRAHVFFGDGTDIARIEIYRATALSEEERRYIEEAYAPGALEVTYEAVF